ncbi:hypothetical protein WA026_002944 [Henosepilachna vigintioctopunctata]|uniref:Retinol dehydrogenase 14 n=1 Tax=Henosepilachna vigintioctopunctata TaxID=420089 RepID=A0AAW1TM15_9CUCU
MWKYIGGAVVTGGIIYGVMRYFGGGICNCSTRLDGLVIIITGANSGIGKALSLELARRGATLVLACRDTRKGLDVKCEILAAYPGSQVHLKYLDLASFASIFQFSEVIKCEFDEIYALVNNAGIFYHPQELTEDGFEITFQTNYLGPFVLTHYLLNSLKSSDHARIVNLSSEAHRMVNVYDLKAVTTCQNEFRSHIVAYSVSKLALILFTRALSKKLSKSNIIVNAVNPGNVDTNIYRHFPWLSNPWLYALQWPIRRLVVKNPGQGAQTALHTLLTSNRSTGQYYTNCKLSLPSPLASNEEIANEYYATTLEILAGIFSTESDC